MRQMNVMRKQSQAALTIHSRIPGARVRRAFLLRCARHGTSRIRRQVGQVNFVLVRDREMARLHRIFSGVRGTTDVLTFDLSETGGRLVEGDIYICLDQARRQAAVYRVPLYEVVARLAVHGILHLAGYDDHSEEERRHMSKLEDLSLEAARQGI
jgi:rRNA maturation RNase YbeY